jgi:hypothetical protein
MEYFRMDNTEGYTQEQLDELNRRVNERVTDVEDAEDIQNICEQVQREFDSE